MGTNADLETAEAVLEHLERTTVPKLKAEISEFITLQDLEATLAEVLKTVEFIKQQIAEKRKGEA